MSCYAPQGTIYIRVALSGEVLFSQENPLQLYGANPTNCIVHTTVVANVFDGTEEYGTEIVRNLSETLNKTTTKCKNI